MVVDFFGRMSSSSSGRFTFPISFQARTTCCLSCSGHSSQRTKIIHHYSQLGWRDCLRISQDLSEMVHFTLQDFTHKWFISQLDWFQMFIFLGMNLQFDRRRAELGWEVKMKRGIATFFHVNMLFRLE